jgi:glycosyltransferase involved in cell wall biosynthesis
MLEGYKISVVMPGRTVSHILEYQLNQIPDFVDEIILVSNRSKDDTLEKARFLQTTNPKLVVLEDNRADRDKIGYGYAIQTGLAATTGDLVFKIDVDGTYPVEILDQVIDYMLANDLDLISCNRYPVRPATKIPWIIRLGVAVLNLEVAILFGYPIKDVISGMYGGKTAAVRSLNLIEGGWDFSIEFKLASIQKFKHKFGEFHIDQKPSQTKSHQNYLKTGLRHMKFIAHKKFEKSHPKL